MTTRLIKVLQIAGVAASLAATIAGLLLSAARLKMFFDGLAPDGTADFFTLELLNGLRATLILAGPCAVALPWLLRVMERVPASLEQSRCKAYGGIAALLVTALLLNGLARIATDPPLTKDAKFYLTASLEIADTGGVTALPGRCFRGEYLEDNRHPLYPGVLSAVAERSDRFSDRARLFSLAGAIATLLVFLRFSRRVWGDGPSLFAALFLMTNGTFLEQAASVACETWQMAVAVLWLDFATREQHRVRSLALAGVCAAIAYLFKGTGTLFVAATGLFLVLRYRWRGFVPLGAFVATFGLVALPLLWRNGKVYGMPFWNINSSKVFWLDEWNEFFDPAAMEQAGLSHYLATHSVADIVVRLGSGMVKETFHLLEVFSPLVPSAGLGFPILLLVAIALIVPCVRGRRLLLLILFSLFFVSFSWYAEVVVGWRFMAVLVPLLLSVLAGLGARAVTRARPLWLAAAAISIAMILFALFDGALSFRPNRFKPAPEHDAVHAFLLREVGLRDSVHYLLGPSDGRTVDWDNRIRGTRHPFPRTPEELDALMHLPWGRVVRYALVEAPTGEREDRVSANWVREEPDGSLVVADPPEGWTLIERIPEDRPRVLVFRRE